MENVLKNNARTRALPSFSLKPIIQTLTTLVALVTRSLRPYIPRFICSVYRKDLLSICDEQNAVPFTAESASRFKRAVEVEFRCNPRKSIALNVAIYATYALTITLIILVITSLAAWLGNCFMFMFGTPDPEAARFWFYSTATSVLATVVLAIINMKIPVPVSLMWIKKWERVPYRPDGTLFKSMPLKTHDLIARIKTEFPDAKVVVESFYRDPLVFVRYGLFNIGKLYIDQYDGDSQPFKTKFDDYREPIKR